jgi:hypothetical protein
MKTINPMNCLSCGKDSGTRIVCEECRLEFTKSQIDKFDRIFQKMVIELFDNCCVDCGHSAETVSGELCADHVEQKYTHPESRYDLACAVCRCSPCHTKRHAGNLPKYPKNEKLPKETQEKKEKVKRNPVCSVAGCPLWAQGSGKKAGHCWKHQ